VKLFRKFLSGNAPNTDSYKSMAEGRPMARLRTLLRTLGGLLLIGTIFFGVGCHFDPAPPSGPISTITPGWTIPAPPAATLNQSYTASVPDQTGCTYVWTIPIGSGTLINATTPVVTFTPTAIGNLQLQCVVTDAATRSSTGTYAVTVGSGATLNASPDIITVGQGTFLLATFSGGVGVINPGSISVTSGVGVTVSPTTTTTYTLTVDGTQVATVMVSVKTFVPKFVYVANDETSISAFTLNTTDGSLTEIAGSPYPAEAEQVASDPKGKFLFAAGGSNGLYAYTINSTTGVLTAVEGSPFTTDSGATTYGVAVDPMGRFVYASADSGLIYAFTLNATTGVLTPVADSPYSTYDNGRGEIIVHPSGKYLYAAMENDNQVDAFSIDQATGALTELADAPYDTANNRPLGMAVDPTGAYVFAKGEYQSATPNTLAGFSVDIASGALTTVANSPFGPLEGWDAWHGLCFHPTKSILYTAFYGSEVADEGAYTLDLDTGALTPMAGSPYDLFSNHGSDNITVDRSGQFAFACNYNADQIKRMRVDGTGLLTKLSGAALDGTEDQDVTPVQTTPISTIVVGVLQ